jgi:RHS repeat-associated protein
MSKNIATLFAFVATTLSAVVNAQNNSEYSYDANGNMIHDSNKRIASIHYNFLNLPDTIVLEDQTKIVYAYTASGTKLRQYVMNGSGGIIKTNEYVNDVLYTDHAVREIQHPEGRIIPSANAWEYQYHVKDHLGNVRMTVTSKRDTVVYRATMETAQANAEEKIFRDLPSRIERPTANHTPMGQEVICITASMNEPSMNLAVNKGDVLYMEVYGYYEDQPLQDIDKGLQRVVQALVGSLAGGIVGQTGGIENAVAGITRQPGVMGLTIKDEPNDYQAFLEYTLYDRNYAMVDGGFSRVTAEANFHQERLTIGPIVVSESGYLRVNLSNTTTGNRCVYFDDLKITHIPIPIVQEDSYDPFGMTQEALHDERYATVTNKHLYNGKEYQREQNLNWYDYGARMYDPALGRWHVSDPLSEKYSSYSPYQYALNNPIKFVDPDGRDIKIYTRRNEEARAAIIREGLSILQSTNEGNRIVSEAENNHNIRVYIVGTDIPGPQPDPNTGKTPHKTSGWTGRQYNAGQIPGPANGPIYLKLEGVVDMSAFDGVEVTDAVRNNLDAYFISIDVNDFNTLGIANTIGHEMEAHVNINQKIKSHIKPDETVDVTANGADKTVSLEFFEHHLFGSPGVNPDGSSHNVRPNSSAQRLNAELNAQRASHLQKAQEKVEAIINYVRSFLPSF